MTSRTQHVTACARNPSTVLPGRQDQGWVVGVPAARSESEDHVEQGPATV